MADADPFAARDTLSTGDVIETIAIADGTATTSQP